MMKNNSIIFLLFTLTAVTGISLSAKAQSAFDDNFYDKTMRFDFFHAGDANSEYYFFDELKEEPYFAGSKTSLINNFGYGVQQVRLVDAASGNLIYQNNYCTLFNEWQTSDEAKQTSKAMPESVTLPYPKKDARIEIYSRNKETGAFEKKFEYLIRANDYNVRKFSPILESFEVSVNGDNEHAIDIVLLPEGFAAGERESFEKACTAWANALFSYAPFTENKPRINVRGVWAPSHDSGVTIPGHHIWKETALHAHFYTFGSERYQMTEDYQTVRDIAANAPYEYIYILSNTDKYGGGGIYNFYGLGSSHNVASSAKVHVHEFGHQLLGLGDEYVEVGNTMSDMYPAGVEPYEANLTNLTHFEAKWKNMLKNETPIPTPLDTAGCGRQMSAWELGVYEGGGYLSKGIYRPMPNCMMNIIHTIDEFCPVCKRAIQQYIDFLCK